ncbi:MAG: hypothetical protein ACKVT0_05405 [Planctomycetaceae bacterium]
MEWWLPALGKTIWGDLIPLLVIFCGSTTGATLGSYRQWYWSRWQCGLFAGWCAGLFSYMFFISHPMWLGVPLLQAFMRFGNSFYPAYQFFDSDRTRLPAVLSALQAFSAAFVISLILPIWLRQAQAHWLIEIRERPFSMWRRNWFRRIGVLFCVLVCVGWISSRWNRIEWMMNQEKCRHYFPQVESLMKTFGVSVELQQASFKVEFLSSKSISEKALTEFDLVSCPLEPVCIFSKEIGDDDLRRLTPRLASTHYIYLRCDGVTDAALLELTKCRRLRQISIIDCFSVSHSGVERFHELRPDVRINADNGMYKIDFRPKSPY